METKDKKGKKLKIEDLKLESFVIDSTERTISGASEQIKCGTLFEKSCPTLCGTSCLQTCHTNDNS